MDAASQNEAVSMSGTALAEDLAPGLSKAKVVVEHTYQG